MACVSRTSSFGRQMQRIRLWGISSCSGPLPRATANPALPNFYTNTRPLPSRSTLRPRSPSHPD